jgi:hypothetical protein
MVPLYKWQTRPLVREGAPYGQESNFQGRINIWSWAPDEARHQDRQTDWQSVAMWLWLWLWFLCYSLLFSVIRCHGNVCLPNRCLANGLPHPTLRRCLPKPLPSKWSYSSHIYRIMAAKRQQKLSDVIYTNVRNVLTSSCEDGLIQPMQAKWMMSSNTNSFRWVWIWQSVAWICMGLLCTPLPCDFPTVSNALQGCTVVCNYKCFWMPGWNDVYVKGWAHGAPTGFFPMWGKGRGSISANKLIFDPYKITLTTAISRGRQPCSTGRATSDFCLSNARLADKNYIRGARIYLLYILSHVWVTIDGVWTRNWIHWPL